MIKKLARLNKVDLREGWDHEERDFSEWLVQEENLNVLCEEIGIPIQVKQREARVGPFRVDVLGEEEGSGRAVIIENQLEETNHDHLGKIITYASGYDAEVIIWIVANAREEHQKAVEWLNENTDEKISFFLIKLELWQIEKSAPAPKFDILVSPNQWAKNVKQNIQQSDLSSTELQQLAFWEHFKQYATDHKMPVRHGRRARPQHWYNIGGGISEGHISLTVDTRKQSIGCELYIPRNKELYAYLVERKNEVAKILGGEPDWIDAERASRVVMRKSLMGMFSDQGERTAFSWYFDMSGVR
jgi:hypothetical protein